MRTQKEKTRNGFFFQLQKNRKEKKPRRENDLYYENDDGVSSFMNEKQQSFYFYFFSFFFWFGFLDWSWFLKLEGRGGVDLQVRMEENERAALQQFRARGEERMRASQCFPDTMELLCLTFSFLFLSCLCVSLTRLF